MEKIVSELEEKAAYEAYKINSGDFNASVKNRHSEIFTLLEENFSKVLYLDEIEQKEMPTEYKEKILEVETMLDEL